MQHQKLFLCLLLCFASTSLFAEATIILNNVDDPNEGYNDLTPATPIGGNTGTTLGEQRQLVMQYAFATWGARLNSCLLYTSPSPRDATLSRMPSSA